MQRCRCGSQPRERLPAHTAEVEGIGVSSSSIGIGFYKIPPGLGQHDDKSLLSFPCVQGVKKETGMGLVRGKLPSVQGTRILLPRWLFFTLQVLSSLGYHVVTFDYRGEGSFEIASPSPPASSCYRTGDLVLGGAVC